MIYRVQSRPSPSISSLSSELVSTMLGSAIVILFHHSSLSWARSSNRFALLQVYPYYFQSMPSLAYPFSLRAQRVHPILRFFFFFFNLFSSFLLIPRRNENCTAHFSCGPAMPRLCCNFMGRAVPCPGWQGLSPAWPWGMSTGRVVLGCALHGPTFH